MTKRQRKILIADDDVSTLRLFGELLRSDDYELTFAKTGAEAREHIEKIDFDVVLTDVELGDLNGLELVELVQNLKRKSLVIVLTGRGDLETAVKATQLGAFDYVTKLGDLAAMEGQLKTLVRRAFEQLDFKEIDKGKRKFSPASDLNTGIIGKSPQMGNVFRLVARATLSRSNVLVVGESGTGKELVARAIHEHSPRAAKPFVAVNCGALTETLLESELFGHAKGSFTGAISAKRGLFEEADGGTIFLDEIGDVSPALQVKLLRVLQEGEFRPVGSNETRVSDVRVIAATHRDLAGMVQAGTFREDLYYRLKVIVIELPTLRSRPDDIRTLANHFLARVSAQMDKPNLRIAEETMAILCRYPWPGNVRELENTIERAAAMTSGDVLFPEDFHEEASFGEVSTTEPQEHSSSTEIHKHPRSLYDVEREHILRTLQEVKFNKSKAADILGVDRVTLYRKLLRYAISAPDASGSAANA